MTQSTPDVESQQIDSLEELSPAELHYRCVDFLNREAELLDAWELNGWHDQLTEDVSYRMPLRLTKEKGASEFSDVSTHFSENYGSLELRIRRFESDYAWSENPPSRIRHFVTNVRVGDVEGDEVAVKSNVLLYRSQLDSVNYDQISGERHDRLRLVDGELKLAEREVYLDHTVVDIEYFSTFL